MVAVTIVILQIVPMGDADGDIDDLFRTVMETGVVVTVVGMTVVGRVLLMSVAVQIYAKRALRVCERPVSVHQVTPIPLVSSIICIH